MPNSLARESSPYLLQHQNNPVAWYPWGAEALERARREDKPIFLSIGYSACHWCHVMEHESFENEAVARYLNDHFISIKVDREERPDLDQIYMNAVQIMTGHGGWPMSVFLTPELKPFFGGTYWPPEPRMGMPGFEQVLIAVHDAWQNRREALLKQADELTGHLQSIGGNENGAEASGGHQPPGTAALAAKLTGQEPLASPSPLAEKADELLDSAIRALSRSFDSRHGGFGRAPKFPHGMDLQLLLRLWRRSQPALGPRLSAPPLPAPDVLHIVTHTLDRMAAGGIYDHLAGGFARYSVDERWLVPHFEKMLYDNALLTSAYLDAYLVTREDRFARIAKETCRYILTYMTDPRGGFHSTEDADSEGEEGKFYVWTPNQIRAALGDAAAERFNYVYDVSEHGNFEHGQSILNLPKSIDQAAVVRGWDLTDLERELAESRTRLLALRDQRVRPGKDDKILVSWNALMIDALARAGRILAEPEFVIAAEKASQFILTEMSRDDGRLLHTWRHGQAKLDAYLDDYSYFINALVTLYEATFNERWVDHAVRLADLMRAHFQDAARGGFYFTADDHETLITRNKDLHDASVPSGNALAATALLRLGKLCGRTEYLKAAEQTLVFSLPVLERMPAAAGQMLIALDFWRGPTSELVLLGGTDEAENQTAIAALQQTFLPHSVTAYRPSQLDPDAPRSPLLEPLFTGRSADQAPALYICENYACQAPLFGSDAIKKAVSPQ